VVARETVYPDASKPRPRTPGGNSSQLCQPIHIRHRFGAPSLRCSRFLESPASPSRRSIRSGFPPPQKPPRTKSTLLD